MGGLTAGVSGGGTDREPAWQDSGAPTAMLSYSSEEHTVKVKGSKKAKTFSYFGDEKYKLLTPDPPRPLPGCEFAQLSKHGLNGRHGRKGLQSEEGHSK